MVRNALGSAPIRFWKSRIVISDLVLSSGETMCPLDATYLALVSGRSQCLNTSHAPSLFLAVESMNSECTLIRAATFLGSVGLGVYGMGASPHRNCGFSARLKIPFIPILPVRNESCEEVARSGPRSEEHTSELQSPCNLVCRLLLEKKKKRRMPRPPPP